MASRAPSPPPPQAAAPMARLQAILGLCGSWVFRAGQRQEAAVRESGPSPSSAPEWWLLGFPGGVGREATGRAGPGSSRSHESHMQVGT